MTAFPQNRRTLRSIPPVHFRPQTNAITTKSFDPRLSDTVFHVVLYHHSTPAHELTRYSQNSLSLAEKTAQTASVVGFPQQPFGNRTAPTSKLLWPNPARKSAPAAQFNQKRRLIAAGRSQTVHFVPQTNFVTARLEIPAPVSVACPLEVHCIHPPP
jgi:hypothetical protein